MEQMPLEELRFLQAQIRRSAEDYGLEPWLEHFDVVVRLTTEFRSVLSALAAGPVDAEEIRYRCESIFSGTEFFCGVSTCYRMMAADAPFGEWAAMSFADLRDTFVAKYERFLTEVNFPVRCRLILDLFKLQLVFAGMAYD